MATQSLRFGGINRNTNLCDSPVGDCEEMINVRSENGALKIEKDRKIISSDIPYTRITTHEIGDATNFIGYDETGIVWFDLTTGDILGRLYESDKDLDKVHICTMNNMVVISDKNIVSNTAYLYKDGKYESFINNDNLNIPLIITHTVEKPTETGLVSDEFTLKTIGILSNEDVKQNYATIQGAYNKFFAENPQWVHGYYLVGVNVTLWDNTETRLTNLTPFYPINMPRDDGNNKFTFHLNNYLKDGSLYGHKIVFDDMVKRHTYHIKELTDDNLKNYIKSVNVYVSQPICPIVFDAENLRIDYHNTSEHVSTYNALRLQASGIEKQLLYKYKSYNIDELKNGITEEIKFGIDALPLNKTLDVDNGLITRAGQIKTYNNRMHFFNSVARVDLNNAYSINSAKRSPKDEKYIADIIIYLRHTDGSDIRIRYNNIALYADKDSQSYYTMLNGMTIVQDSRAYKIIFSMPGQYAECLLESSPRYNYSYGFFKKLNFIEDDKYDEVTSFNIYQETDAINVTSQNNPVYFPVEHSYKFDGQVRDIAYATEPISQTQIGQYPLYVFTDKGVYALEQGSGAVLYSNITLINTDKILSDKPTCLTRNGVAYIANGNVYILAGRNNLNISQSLKGNPDMDIRDSKSFQVCCQNDKLYNITQYLSDDSVEKFLDKAQLCYSPINDELYVCNVDYAYSYVFSFLYKNWHKRDGNYISINDNLFLAEKKTSTTSIRTATGKIYVSDIITHPEHTFQAASRCIVDKDYISSSNGEWISLYINDQYATSYNFTHATNLRVIIATLLQADLAADYDEYYDGQQHVIYSALPETEANLRIERASDSYTILDASFEAYANSVLIPGKGIGATITISGTTERGDVIETFEDTTRAITEADTETTIAEMITQFINDNQVMLNVRAVRNQTQIDLTARINGEAGNNTSISCSCSDPYIGISVQDLSGGDDNYTETIYHNEIYDMSQEVDCIKTIHIQSRPISWPNAHTLINRFILNCKAQLSPEHNLSVYVFASNNLHTWGCVAASQKTDVIIDHIRLHRVARAWKHFIVIIGGKVYSNTELATINLDIEHKINNKLR